MKIYTKTGDAGETSLVRGTRVSKDDISVETYGTIDELNSFIGLLSSWVDEPFLEEIQKKLFYVGGYFANEMAISSGISTDDIQLLEKYIDALDSQLEPLNCFILPGGNKEACICHVCRTVCRRAERRMISYKNSRDGEIDSNVFAYINRLSDYLFQLARVVNSDEKLLDYA